VAYTEPVPVEEPTRDDTLERYGIAISAGGGVAGFTDGDLRDTTNDGGSWGVRATFGTRSWIGVEAEYIGSAQSIDALGLDNDTTLIGNGVQGVGRINLIDSNVQPFLFGGLAWRHYGLSYDGVNTSDVHDDDDVLEVPMGAGIAWKYRGLLLDARGEFRYATYEDMVPDVQGGDLSMHRYGFNANVGYAF